jgi:hypothetical protein
MVVFQLIIIGIKLKMDFSNNDIKSGVIIGTNIFLYWFSIERKADVPTQTSQPTIVNEAQVRQ